MLEGAISVSPGGSTIDRVVEPSAEFDANAGLAGALDVAALLTADLRRHIRCGATAMPHLDRQQIADKLIAETALLLLMASRAPHIPGRPGRILGLAGTLARFARAPRYYAQLAASPQAALGIALAHVALTLLGFEDRLFDEAVADALDDPSAEAIDRPGFRHLELIWLRALHAEATPDFGFHPDVSLLQHKLHPAWMRREDGYAATHAAMYLTDFGRQPLPASIRPDRIAFFLDHSLTWCAAARDWDLLAEILIAGIASHQPAARHGWALRQLAGRFSEHGALFGPACETSAIPPGREWMQSSELLLHAYHPTFVYGILCALELNAPSAGHRHVRDSDGADAAIEGELILLTRNGPWDALLNRLQELEPTAEGRLAESCEAAAAKLIRIIRAKAAERS